MPDLIRVVVADDSDTVRLHLRQWLTPALGFDVVGEAATGHECVRLVARLRPSIVVMDIDMPGMDGLEATRQVMSATPTPIVVFTSSSLARERNLAFEALAAGALEVVHKSRGVTGGEAASLDAEADRFRRLLTLLAPIKVIRRRTPAVVSSSTPPALSPLRARPRVLALGASTGGPAAVATVLGALPRAYPLGILLVQHQALEFMQGFVDWLRSTIDLPVKMGAEGEALRPGVVFVAPGDQHMRLGPDGRIRLDREPPMHACRPAADALFASVASVHGPMSIGVLLSGMGRDGAAGLLEMRRQGAITVAQDESTSVVYGMPRAAVELDAAAEVLPVDAIGDFVVAAARTEAST